MEKEGKGNASVGKNIGFSGSYMDTTVDPYVDFYRYANGKWLDSNPIPPDKTGWGAFSELRDMNLQRMKEILEECSTKCTDEGKSNTDLVGRFYKSVMNTAEIEKRRFDDVSPYIDKIEGATSMEALFKEIVHLHQSGIFPFFSTFSNNDEKNSSVYAFYFYQGGLSLPNRDYYLEEKFREVRDYYKEYVIKAWEMYGHSRSTAEEEASSIVKTETEIAKASRKQEDLRDAERNYNKLTVVDFNSRYSSLNLENYLAGIGVRKADYVIVGQPEYLDFASRFLKEGEIEELKIYVKWIVLNSFMPMLHKEAEDLHFDMFFRKIMGQKEPEDRWKKAVRTVDTSIGEALGELYMQKYFGEDSRKKMNVMIEEIKDVFREKIKSLDWMSDGTREKALQKFSRFRAKIGGPVRFRDYTSVEILPDDYAGNVMRASRFEIRRQAERVGNEVDREEWYMTPPTVNAYFNPTENEIVFPAGIIQPPFFDPSADDPVNYGGIGSVICHEITHGYDDQGRRYDDAGNLRDWWTEEDAAKFTEKAKQISDLYGSLESVPGFRVNGQLTLGENIADFGGISISYAALQKHLANHPELRREIDGFTPEQRFFLSCAQIWRQNIREEMARMLISIDPHSPGKFRGMVPLYNHPEFVRAFKSTGGLNKPVYCRDIIIW
ncbi:MAG: M13 family metallopeptidase [Candidatus Thermoplasmatota archaeon]|nr:M13 family metallopeptidase [Candidatus Thermoplasmatota archaeon]